MNVLAQSQFGNINIISPPFFTILQNLLAHLQRYRYVQENTHNI